MLSNMINDSSGRSLHVTYKITFILLSGWSLVSSSLYIYMQWRRLQAWARRAKPPKCRFSPHCETYWSRSGGELCEIFKFWSFLQSKSVNDVCKTPFRGVAPGPPDPLGYSLKWKFLAPPLFTRLFVILCDSHTTRDLLTASVAVSKSLHPTQLKLNCFRGSGEAMTWSANHLIAFMKHCIEVSRYSLILVFVLRMTFTKFYCCPYFL